MFGELRIRPVKEGLTPVPTHALHCTHPRRMIRVFQNSTGTCSVCIAMEPGQPAGLSKELCLYAGAEWLICRSEGGERSINSLLCLPCYGLLPPSVSVSKGGTGSGSLSYHYFITHTYIYIYIRYSWKTSDDLLYISLYIYIYIISQMFFNCNVNKKYYVFGWESSTKWLSI